MGFERECWLEDRSKILDLMKLKSKFRFVTRIVWIGVTVFEEDPCFMFYISCADEGHIFPDAAICRKDAF